MIGSFDISNTMLPTHLCNLIPYNSSGTVDPSMLLVYPHLLDYKIVLRSLSFHIVHVISLIVVPRCLPYVPIFVSLTVLLKTYEVFFYPKVIITEIQLLCKIYMNLIRNIV